MPRRKRPLDRDSGVQRDAALVIIASEDKYAVKQYFELFRSPKVQFLVVPTEDTRSAPDEVLSRLVKAAAEFESHEGDSFWLCIDTDHWSDPNHIANLANVLQQCRQKGYKVAISNPCFELWLLLHFEDWSPSGTSKCADVTMRLRQAAGGYDKRKCFRLPIDESRVDAAVRRAAAMDTSNDEIPEHIMSRVYQIVQDVLRSGSARIGG